MTAAKERVIDSLKTSKEQGLFRKMNQKPEVIMDFREGVYMVSMPLFFAASVVVTAYDTSFIEAVSKLEAVREMAKAISDSQRYMLL